VGPRAVLGAVVKRKIPSPRRKSNPRTPVILNKLRFTINNSWFYGLLRRVVWWLDINVSEHRTASVFRVKISRYQRFRGPCCRSATSSFEPLVSTHFNPEHGGSMILRNISIQWPLYTAHHPKKTTNFILTAVKTSILLV
jgi:hypothetical protein